MTDANQKADLHTEQPKERDSKKEMNHMFSVYLASNPHLPKDKKTSELEIRFNPPQGKKLSKNDYDNVIQYLYSAGFKTDNPKGLHILRIQNEYTEMKKTDGQAKAMTRISNIRAEICGVDLIQEYCRTNSLQKILNMPSTMSAISEKIKFTQKTPVVDPVKGRNIMPVDFRDYNFRVAYQMEQIFSPRANAVRNIVDERSWADSKKVFRHLNRVQFHHPDYPVYADISIVRSSPRVGNIPKPEYTVQDAKLFENEMRYEIELEIVNSMVGPNTPYNTVDKLLAAVRKVIRIVLSALQGSNYPVSVQEQNQVLHSYLGIIHGDQFDALRYNVSPRDFLGPSSRTLQIENIVPVSGEEQTTVPNIRSDYCVTEKADGERKLLYIHDNGRLYFIDTNMRVQFTGSVTKEKKIFGTLLDGEHIKYDKNGKYIHLYAAFDIYYLKKKSLRELPFSVSAVETADSAVIDPALPKNASRLVFLDASIKMAALESVTEDSAACAMRIQCKEFLFGPATMANMSVAGSIFDKCATIMRKINDGLYEYNTDGLIFTPMSYAVGCGPESRITPKHRVTWDHSFKWKPPQFNTIDFLVRVEKDKSDRDKTYTLFKNGLEYDKADDAVVYKKLILHCGFDEEKHRYLNPFESIIQGNIPRLTGEDDEMPERNTYKARPFIPSNPYDETASICNIELRQDGAGHYYMETEEGEYFEENTIVEFKYDIGREGGWRWIPIRVRHDKTAQLASGKRNFGNDYMVANSNWRSIHSPITSEIISTGVVEAEVGADVYYNRKSVNTNTRALRDFHNLYVKRKLIGGAANPHETLIDLSVGKAGDLSKWRAAKLRFVLGIDYSKDNIMNVVDGACARYISEAGKYPGIFGAVFLHGNSALNIRSGKAFETYKEQMIAKSVFGEGAQNRKELGDGIYKFHAIAKDGFHVCSCQFSLHYFFESVATLHGFIRNVSECTRVGGFFVGTCWDGKIVFDRLRGKSEGDGITIMRDGRKLFQLVRLYSETSFPEDEQSLGYKVNVYQESIGQPLAEYLVNFQYFQRLMEDYGFVVISREEAVKFGLPSGTDTFETMFYSMEDETKRQHRNAPMKNEYGMAASMTEDEKFISFMNRYFVFRKVRNVATKNIERLLKPVMGEDDGVAEENHNTIEGIAKTLAAKKADADVAKPGIDATKKKVFIRKIDYPKVAISVYVPVKEGDMENTQMEEVQEMARKYESFTVVPEEVTGPEIRLKKAIPPPEAIVKRGEKKIRIPKVKG
jgi:hypothetical protein